MEIPEYTIPKLISVSTINNLSSGILQQILNVLPVNKNVQLKAIAKEGNCSIVDVHEVYVNILSVFTEAAKYDYSMEKLDNELHNTRIQKSHIKLICDAYDIHKNSFRRSLQVIGNSLPHIIDIQWKLEHSVKNNALQLPGPRYTICLTLIKDNKLNSIKFVCNFQQLQEIVLKLKDASCHLEKLSAC